MGDLVVLCPIFCCARTGNPCGTDTMVVGGECDCIPCRQERYVRAAEQANKRVAQALRSARSECNELRGELSVAQHLLRECLPYVEQLTPGMSVVTGKQSLTLSQAIRAAARATRGQTEPKPTPQPSPQLYSCFWCGTEGVPESGAGHTCQGTLAHGPELRAKTQQPSERKRRCEHGYFDCAGCNWVDGRPGKAQQPDAGPWEFEGVSKKGEHDDRIDAFMRDDGCIAVAVRQDGRLSGVALERTAARRLRDCLSTLIADEPASPRAAEARPVESAKQLRERLGFPELSEEQQQANLRAAEGAGGWGRAAIGTVDDLRHCCAEAIGTPVETAPGLDACVYAVCAHLRSERIRAEAAEARVRSWEPIIAVSLEIMSKAADDGTLAFARKEDVNELSMRWQELVRGLPREQRPERKAHTCNAIIDDGGRFCGEPATWWNQRFARCELHRNARLEQRPGDT